MIVLGERVPALRNDIALPAGKPPLPSGERIEVRGLHVRV
jgi:hypothetical protein